MLKHLEEMSEKPTYNWICNNNPNSDAECLKINSISYIKCDPNNKKDGSTAHAGGKIFTMDYESCTAISQFLVFNKKMSAKLALKDK